MDCMTVSSVHGLGFSLDLTEQSVLYALAPNEEYGDGVPAQHYAELLLFVWVYYAKGVSTRLMKQAKGMDPIFQHIGIGSDLRNWMPDTGASSHFTSC
jgi:hypothetical protein